jgi:acid phosphatase type 7
MPTLSSRARLISLALLLAVAVALLLLVWLRPRTIFDIGSLQLPSQLPSRAPAVASGSPGPDPAVLLAVGDIGSCEVSADEAVADLAARLPGTIALLGDTVYGGGSSEQFSRCFDPAWGPMKSRIRPAVGNHEYETEGAAGYFNYFGAAAGEEGRGWYSYDLGAWHVVVLNSNCGEVGCGTGSDQFGWLQADLATNDSDCLLAYWHHPRFSSGRHGSTEAVDPFWDAMHAAGVDVVVSGHDHTYERLSAEGVRQFVVGTGGRSLYPFEKPALPETETRSDSAYGLLWLYLGGGTYEWEYVPLGMSGYTDGGSDDCG